MTWFSKAVNNFSIAHKVHKAQMITGFTTPDPQSFADYDDARCNILFESRPSNMTKWEYKRSQCEDILVDLAKVKLVIDGLYSVPFDCERVPVGDAWMDEGTELANVDSETDDQLDELDGDEDDEDDHRG